MKNIRLFLGLLLLSVSILLVACSNEDYNYNGESLKIAVIGDIPEFKNEKVSFKKISLDEFSENTLDVVTNFDAVMITPSMFNEASNDKYVKTYLESEMPIIFFNSVKSNVPFTNENVDYKTAHWDSLINGSHTSVYLSDLSDKENQHEDTWNFYLEDKKNKKAMNKLYKEVFEKVEELK